MMGEALPSAPPQATAPAVGPPAPALHTLVRLTSEQDSPPVLRRLLWFRWVAVFGQALTIAVVLTFTDAPLRAHLLFALVGLGALSNLLLHARLRRHTGGPHLARAVIVLDVLLLTGLLLASGGSANPFSVFYLVHVVLAGYVLGTTGTQWVAALTVLCFGLLFVLPSLPLEGHHHSAHDAHNLHFQGMWVAYMLAAASLAVFVTGLTKSLARRERELIRLRARTERSERLAALAAFSASAAHELGSPLTTIAITAKELERGLSQLDPARIAADLPLHLDDVQLIRAEVERSRTMLHELSRRGGLHTGERPEICAVDDLWAEAIERVRLRPNLRVSAPDPSPGLRLILPRTALIQTLVNVIENAHEAHERAQCGEAIQVGTRAQGELICLWVRDRGPGFDAQILADLGQPFTTSRPGEGLGLGLHLADNLAHTLGGHLDVRSSAAGSEVALCLPLSALRAP